MKSARKHDSNSGSGKDRNQRFWLAQAQLLRTKMRWSQWAGSFLRPYCCLCAAAACAVLLERRLSPETQWAWLGFLFLALLGAIYFLVKTLRNEFSLYDALAWLDDVLKLDNRLSTARAGVGSWPEEIPVDDGLRWNYRAIVWPLLLSTSILALAGLVPVSSADRRANAAPGKPAAWQQVEDSLEALKQSPIIDERSLQDFEKKLGELVEQDPQKWYSHGSLEAGEQLKSQLEHGLSELERNLGKTGSALESWERQANSESGNNPGSAGSRATEEIAGALKGLQSGELPLQQQLAEQLKDLSPDQLAKMTPEERQKLRESLREGRSIIRYAKRRIDGRSAGEKGNQQGEQQGGKQGGEHGGRQGGQQGSEGGTPCDSTTGGNEFCRSQPQSSSRTVGPNSRGGGETGSGGISRGPGTAPLALDPRPGLGGLDKIEVIQGADLPDENQDYETVYSIEAPQVDRRAEHQLLDSADAAAQDLKGAPAWKQEYTPDEQTVLQKFFK